MTLDVAQIWSRIQDELRREVTDTTYELWLAPLRPAGYEGDVLLVEAPGAIRGWVADRFAATLDRAAATVLGPHARVELAGDGEAPPAKQTRGSRGPARTAETPPPGAVREELNPKFTFDQFILGDGNRFAHAAA